MIARNNLEDNLALISLGDSSAFLTLHRATCVQLSQTCLAMIRDKGRAEDALQETYLLIWLKASSYRADLGPTMPWLRAIARNCCINDMRRRQSGTVELTEVYEAPDPSPSPLRDLQTKEDTARLRKSVSSLTIADADAITAIYLDEEPYHVTAAKTSSPIGTVKSRVHRALAKMRENLSISQFELHQTD